MFTLSNSEYSSTQILKNRASAKALFVVVRAGGGGQPRAFLCPGSEPCRALRAWLRVGDGFSTKGAESTQSMLCAYDGCSTEEAWEYVEYVWGSLGRAAGSRQSI